MYGAAALLDAGSHVVIQRHGLDRVRLGAVHQPPRQRARPRRCRVRPRPRAWRPWAASAATCRSARSSRPTTSSRCTSASRSPTATKGTRPRASTGRGARSSLDRWAGPYGRPAHDGGVYWQTIGPRFETQAEIRLIAGHADLVGMTIASECVLAGELGCAYAAVCVVDNLANGIGDVPLTMEEFRAGAAANRARLVGALDAVLPSLGKEAGAREPGRARRAARRRAGRVARRGRPDRQRSARTSSPRPETTCSTPPGWRLLPGLVNGHTHAAMTLMRGYGDDLPLMEWLQDRIWPIEAKLTADDVYWGTRLACVEMIRSGTVRFWDMYWQPEAVARAVEDAGIRAVGRPPARRRARSRQVRRAARRRRAQPRRARRVPALASHPRSVRTPSIRSVRSHCTGSPSCPRSATCRVHIHLSETEGEVQRLRRRTWGPTGAVSRSHRSAHAPHAPRPRRVARRRRARARRGARRDRS